MDSELNQVENIEKIPFKKEDNYTKWIKKLFSSKLSSLLTVTFLLIFLLFISVFFDLLPQGKNSHKSAQHNSTPKLRKDDVKILPEGFISFVEDNKIVVKDIKLGKKRIITQEKKFSRPSIAPNGAHIAIFDKENILWIVDANGENLQKVSNDPVHTMKWSPNSKKLAFTNRNNFPSTEEYQMISPSKNNLYIYDVEKKNATEVLQENPGGATGGITFSWSPDGRLLAYGLIDKVGFIDFRYQNKIVHDFQVVNTESEWTYVPEPHWMDGVTFMFSIPTNYDRFTELQDIFIAKEYLDQAIFLRRLSSNLSFKINPENGKTLIIINNQEIYPPEPNGTVYLGNIELDNWKEIFSDPNHTLTAEWLPKNKSLFIIQQSSYMYGEQPDSFLFNLKGEKIAKLPFPLTSSGIFFDDKTDSFLGSTQTFDKNVNQYMLSAYLVHSGFNKFERILYVPVHESDKAVVSAYFK